MSGLQGKIADAVKAKGYQVVTSPDKAYYWIQANVLKPLRLNIKQIVAIATSAPFWHDIIDTHSPLFILFGSHRYANGYGVLHTPTK